ncbi:hypothetical protein [Novosphingobium sp. MMS21-SN21R]|uniref:hypothetical protein n=1 Tax=Novosphingobium sp. MMS21-SN21R TaxID=2969298 RepID=UPI002887FF5E|nr:hypothetical protein [Novosphingobium sp. MMS21-SN21R]MDT0507504.1 hypothetical protein [Novosphingobium sp. MMS21-SN21R]
MSETDVDQIAYGLLSDARIIGCASASQLASHLEWLVEVQDNVARAIEKARSIRVPA